MYTICSIICETLSKNEFKIKKIIEIEMVEVGSKQIADPPVYLKTTINWRQIRTYSIGKQIARLITKSSIGNKTMLPQQVRVRVKAKVAENARMIG